MNLLQNFDLAVIEYLYLVGLQYISSLTNNRTFENQLHAAGAELALVILNKQQ